jgi:hypothetical protein
MIATTAIAKPETNTIGPYKVSFDLNTTFNHTVKLAQPIDSPSAVLYNLFITTGNYTLAQLSIIESKNLTDSTLPTDKYINELNMIIKGYFKNISLADTEIDGKKGFIYTGLNTKNMRLFQASYWLDRKDCECGPVSIGTTQVAVTSAYPLNVTLDLIKTLHIEKITQAEKPKILTFGPPKMS